MFLKKGNPTVFANSIQKHNKMVGIQNEKFLEKRIISTSKAKTSSKSYYGNSMKFAGLTQNPKKIIGTPNQPIRTKISVMEPKIRMGGYPQNQQDSS
jgi:hypothetical protein